MVVRAADLGLLEHRCDGTTNDSASLHDYDVVVDAVDVVDWAWRVLLGRLVLFGALRLSALRSVSWREFVPVLACATMRGMLDPLFGVVLLFLGVKC